MDGDTSTNDSVFLLASGAAGGAVIKQGTARAALFQRTLEAVCIHLARAVARDGEGAMRLITATVRGAKTPAEARLAARTIVSSALVKMAVHAPSRTGGGLIAAAGRSGAALVERSWSLPCAACPSSRMASRCPLTVTGRLPYAKRKKSRLGSTSI